MADDKETVVKEKSVFDFRIILVGLLLFLAAMGVSYFTIKSLIAPLVPEANEKNKEILSGNLIEVGEFTTNINASGQTRYLKVNVTLEVSADDKKAGETINKYLPVIQDSIIEILASQGVADLDVRNRNNLKTEIIQDINNKIGREIVKNIYFTDFIMQ
ncbi:MAG: flagellar basal body-associated FliL family protein [Syntrophomonadaceae bacterium]